MITVFVCLFSKTAAIQDSFEYRFGMRRNARLNPGKFYKRLQIRFEIIRNSEFRPIEEH